MKALLFVAGWLGVGAALGLRTPGEPFERLLAVLFWPFFLVQPPAPASGRRVDPLSRLRSALGDGQGSEEQGAHGLADELERALDAIRARLARIEGAIGELGSGDTQAVSRRMLEEARVKARADLDEALAAVEEAATRLVLAQAAGGGGQVEAILAALRDRLLAEEELSEHVA